MINKLIVRLLAIANYAKDIHYTCAGQAAYSKHLFADLLQDDVYDFIDSLKEDALLGQRTFPEPSKYYLEEAAKLIPSIHVEDKKKFQQIAKLIDDTRDLIKNYEAPTRGIASLVDGIGEHLDKCAGLLFLQTRDDSVSESADFKKEDCEGCEETPVDRKEAKRAKIDGDKVAKTVREYEDNNILVAEESALDRVSKKLGLE